MAPGKAVAEQTSELIDKVHHEHAHMRRLFDDLASSFEAIAAGEYGESEQKRVVEAAAEDLEVALEEMLHHFDQEEEIFFVDIEERFPHLKSKVNGLVEAHEEMSQRTRWLQEQLSQESVKMVRNLEVIVDVLGSMAQLVDRHTQEETQLFQEVLDEMPQDEQQALLNRMQQI